MLLARIVVQIAKGDGPRRPTAGVGQIDQFRPSVGVVENVARLLVHHILARLHTQQLRAKVLEVHIRRGAKERLAMSSCLNKTRKVKYNCRAGEHHFRRQEAMAKSVQGQVPKCDTLVNRGQRSTRDLNVTRNTEVIVGLSSLAGACG